MIPRPKTDAAARHDSGRWVCNRDPGRCSGLFRVYGQDMACPLWGKCQAGAGNTYQWTPGAKYWGRYPALDVDAGRRKSRDRLRMELKRLFAPEKCKRKPRTPAQKEENARKERERRAKHRPPPKPVPLPDRPLLPCGEDCEGGCPYDGPEHCPYTDADMDALAAEAKREKERQRSREKYQRQKARMAVDADYAERFRAGNRRRNKRHYEAHKDVLRAQARERQKMRRNKKCPKTM